jgi:hypothetical protein
MGKLKYAIFLIPLLLVSGLVCMFLFPPEQSFPEFLNAYSPVHIPSMVCYLVAFIGAVYWIQFSVEAYLALDAMGF